MATIRIFSLFFFWSLFSVGTAQKTYGIFENPLNDYGKKVAIFRYDSSITDQVNQLEMHQLTAFHIENAQKIDTIFHKVNTDSNWITRYPEYEYIYKVNQDGTRYKYTRNNSSIEQFYYNKQNMLIQQRIMNSKRQEIIEYDRENQITCKYIEHPTGYNIYETDIKNREIHAQEYNKFWNHLTVRSLDTINGKGYRTSYILEENDTVGFRQASLDGKFYYRQHCWDSSSTLSERGLHSNFYYREDIGVGHYEETINLPGVYEFKTYTYDNDSISTITQDSQKITMHFRNNAWLSKEIEYNPTPGYSRNRTRFEKNFAHSAETDYGKDVFIYSKEHPYQVEKRLFYSFEELAYDSAQLNHQVIDKPHRSVAFTYNKYGNRKKITVVENGEKTVRREWDNYFLRWKAFKARIKRRFSFKKKRLSKEVYQRPYMPIAELHQLAEFGITTQMANPELDYMREHVVSFHTDTSSIRMLELKELLSKTESRNDTNYTVTWHWQNDTCIVTINNERITPNQLANRLIEKVRFYGDASTHTVLPTLNQLYLHRPKLMHNCWLWVPEGKQQQFSPLGENLSTLQFTWKIK